jgi:hypothetical protein
MDLGKLQSIIENATANEQVIGEMRKAFGKLQVAFDELTEVFQPGYQPAKKERKPRAEGAKRPGRPKKVENQG